MAGWGSPRAARSSSGRGPIRGAIAAFPCLASPVLHGRSSSERDGAGGKAAPGGGERGAPAPLRASAPPVPSPARRGADPPRPARRRCAPRRFPAPSRSSRGASSSSPGRAPKAWRALAPSAGGAACDRAPACSSGPRGPALPRPRGVPPAWPCRRPRKTRAGGSGSGRRNSALEYGIGGYRGRKRPATTSPAASGVQLSPASQGCAFRPRAQDPPVRRPGARNGTGQWASSPRPLPFNRTRRRMAARSPHPPRQTRRTGTASRPPRRPRQTRRTGTAVILAP